MMVVLFVMGLLAGVVVLSLPGDQRVLREEAERFAARTVAARDEAISGARQVRQLNQVAAIARNKAPRPNASGWCSIRSGWRAARRGCGWRGARMRWR